MKRTPIDAYLQRFDGAQYESLTALRDVLRDLLPDSEECLSYKMPCFKLDGKAVAGFDGFKDHNSYFPHSGNVVGSIGDVPRWCSKSRGTIKFPIDKSLSKSVVRRLVRARLQEIAERGR